MHGSGTLTLLESGDSVTAPFVHGAIAGHAAVTTSAGATLEEAKGSMRIEDVSPTTLDDLQVEFTCASGGETSLYRTSVAYSPSTKRTCRGG